ncbi:hypothetical protein VE25_14530 [Devosia geojensis]|uniref:HIT domain-containing protein n=1 Tax=Devosia geojensis TaxID=443610 RepID=A0A0F5FQ34_9HYPH|nr:hypothetical protein [Devosia geojensis]KKB11004.1 hypothetical protein VE25_14530 [Devosia geojensis]
MSAPADTVVGQRVALAREGRNPWLVARVSSGWVVMSDKQVVPGQLILLADPVVTTLNDLGPRERISFLTDMVLIGDALLAVTGCLRVNYDILGNTDPALHAHIVPRYVSETEERRVMPIWLYDWSTAELFSEDIHGELRRALGVEIARLTLAQAAE